MSELPQPPPAASSKVWNQDLVFGALGHRRRRGLLFSLARGGARPGSILTGSSNSRFDAALKQLAVLRKAGLVVTEEDETDGRRLRCALAPDVPLRKTPEGSVLNFGFCLVRLAEIPDEYSRRSRRVRRYLARTGCQLPSKASAGSSVMRWWALPSASV
jgi:hypothetical protein